MKRAQFHGATITVAVAIVDDERSYGLQQRQINLLMDTPKEWQAAREAIQEEIAKMSTELEKADADRD